MNSRLMVPLFIITAAFIVCPAADMRALEVPPMMGRINDHANLLNPSRARDLEGLLAGYEDRTSAQMALLTLPSLEGENLEMFSMEVVEKWALGQADRDNGILLLIVLKEKKIRLEVGYGLEHIVTDLKARFIIDRILVPRFKRGEYFAGIQGALEKTGGLITRESSISAEELKKYREKKNQEDRGFALPFSVVFIILFLLFGGIGGRRRRRGSGLGYLLLGSMLAGSGRSSGSGFGGGGFGGFSGGGGGFGGGGASGGW